MRKTLVPLGILFVVIVFFTWNTLDRIMKFLKVRLGMWLIGRRVAQMTEEEEEECICHIIDLVRRNRAMLRAERTGDRSGLDEYYRELRDGGK